MGEEVLNIVLRLLAAVAAGGVVELRFSLGEAEASMNIRPILRTVRALSHLLPARGLGAAESQADGFSIVLGGDHETYDVARHGVNWGGTY
ncbi:MAG: hypothetical protein A3G24_06475 [Betaproteobacteria bacterium RIFCSPLOWO2_12_FULL_62_13]|nr:MAG: hypothetical protein A3G24_06475 [Betaproteobacteria bacterium RIFCSPLOWO2_12_FULL_62_13]